MMLPPLPLLLIALSLCALGLSCNHVRAAEFHVAPDGDDAAAGTAAAPFATLERARDAVRTLKDARGLPEGGVAVMLRGGVHRRDATFALTTADGGAPGSPVVYRAAEGEQVRLVGGVDIPPEAFRPVTDEAILARLDEAARGNVLQADLRALGATGFEEDWPVTFRGYAGWPELFFAGEPMQMARWPNEGFARMGEVVDRGSRPRWQETPERPGAFRYDGDRPERWLTADEVYLSGYWCFRWYDQAIRVAEIDTEDKVIRFAAPHVYGIGGPSGGDYFALNLLEELDTPGEYFLDRRTGLLYFWPPAAVQGKEIGLSLLSEPMISLADTSHLVIQGLTLEFTRGQVVIINGGEENRLVGCTIRNIATDAVRVAGGRNNGVQSCDMYSMGGSGIALSGGDRATLTPCGNFAENNHIHHFGRLARTHKDAISLNGVGCRASHNLMHDAPHHAMNFGGNDHVVEFNEIHDVCTETDDAGAIYTGRDWTVRGNVIRHNFWHHIGGDAHVGNQAIYLDDNACGTVSYGNVIYRAYRAFLIGGGRDNVADNNIIVDCRIPMHIDNRGMSWSGENTENWGTLTGRLNALPYQQEPWATRYPELVNILEDDPGMPKRNRVTRNLIVRSGNMNIAAEAREHGTIEDNWATDEDPGFVDAAAMNFNLREDSPVFERVPGFEPIPFDRIGLYVDEHRRSLPPGKPTVLPTSTAFVEELTVQIVPSAGAEDARIRYTLDGTEPDATSALYREPVRITGDVTLKAAAFREVDGHMARSGTTRETYLVRHLGPDAGVYLSDLQPVEAHAHGGLKRDVNYAGPGPVILGGRAFDKSLMLHPAATDEGGRSHALYALDGGLENATRFKAVIGVDDAVGERGSVTFAVEVRRDGAWERIFDSDVFHGGRTEPQEIELDISGADQLRLLCTDAGDNINADHAVWAGAILQ